ncbi:hypothetical protein B0H14DRAFT_2706135 [Mycena olivaceomarginata]|nr:hypothetical protein B0H14DRAFT_2706135 [Mycena olivaceomarginata]
MAPTPLSKFLLAAAVFSSANAYFLFGMNNVITTERLDPIVSPGKVSGHTHTIVGGSNFRASTNTSYLRQSECTSSPIKEDKSNYWAPTLYFQWKNGSFTSVSGSPVMYYLFSDTAGVTTPFPDDFRMLSGTPTLRSYDASSFAQQAITFLCLDFSGTSTKHSELPAQECPSGIRAQINFPSCWDGKNTDSADHKSHVAYLSDGPDSGTCKDPNFPKTLPRIFMEMYLDTAGLYAQRANAMNPSQPFVYAMGDPTGYGYHADFMMGWDKGVLDKVVDKCQCTSAAFGDPTCCSTAGYFTFKKGGTCRITRGVDEIATGTLPALPGNNPVVPLNGLSTNLVAPVTPALLSPVYVYTGDSSTQIGEPVGPPVTATGAGAATSTPAAGSTSTSAAGTTSTPVAVSSSSPVKASSTKGAGTTKNGATSTSVPVSAPTSGSGSPGQGSGSSSGSGSGSSNGGSGSSSPSKGSGSGSSGSGSGSSGSSSNGSGSSSPSKGSGSGSSGSGSGSGYPGSPSTGSGSNSGTPSNGSSSNSGANSSPGSSHSSGSGNKACHKKTSHSKRTAAQRARAFHESSRRRFASLDARFVEEDF